MTKSSPPSTNRRRPGPGPAIGIAPAGALLLAVLLLAIPLVALAQSTPLRDRGRIDDPAPTAAARLFRPEATTREGGTSALGESIRSRVAGRSEPPKPSRRPRPDPAPVSLAPDATAIAEPEPARPRTVPAPGAPPAGAAQGRSPRVWPLAPGTFEVSQPFGCVSQLHGYYPAVAGCPPEAPVVHDGVDFAAGQGTPIYAAAAGWVTMAGLDRATGVANTQIVIQHDGANEGYATEYLHWVTTYVEPGDYVQAGEPIAEVGSVGYSTGPHLHFTVVDFITNERIDPVRWLPETPRSGAYLGLLPGRSPVSFASVNVPVPDYADPAPPPVPTAQHVPAVAPATSATQSADPEPTPTANDQSAATSATLDVPAPASTAHVDQATDAGTSRNDRNEPKRDRRPRNQEPAPTEERTTFVPDATLNPMVTTPVPEDEPEGDGGRKRRNKRDR